VEALPVLPVDGVEPVVDGVELVGEVEAVVLPVLVLFEGVQGATDEVVPVPLVPVALPLEVELVGLAPGLVVCRVPIEPVDPVDVDGVDVVPG
jgi:hypothetical protein